MLPIRLSFDAISIWRAGCLCKLYDRYQEASMGRIVRCPPPFCRRGQTDLASIKNSTNSESSEPEQDDHCVFGISLRPSRSNYRSANTLHSSPCFGSRRNMAARWETLGFNKSDPDSRQTDFNKCGTNLSRVRNPALPPLCESN